MIRASIKTADNWEIGTRTAAFGGVTTVIDFATQFPGMTFPEALDARLKECEPALIDYGLHMMVTDLPRDPDEARRWLEELRDLGVPSIKLYTTYRPNYYADDATLLHTFRAMPKDMIAMVHCENDAIVTDATQRLVEAGQTSWAYHGQARPPEAEIEAIRRVMHLAHEVRGAPVYIVHCSTMRFGAGLPCRSITDLGEGAPAFAKPARSISCWTTAVMRGRMPSISSCSRRCVPKMHHRSAIRWHVGALSAISTDHCDYTLAQKQEYPEFHQDARRSAGAGNVVPADLYLRRASGSAAAGGEDELGSADAADRTGAADVDQCRAHLRAVSAEGRDSARRGRRSADLRSVEPK